MLALNGAVTLARGVAVRVEEWFLGPADARAYAALRIGYACAGLAVLVDFWPLRLSLLSKAGMFGGAAPSLSSPLNVFAWVHDDMGVTMVSLIAGVALVCLGLGVLPRLSAIVAYLWAVSYSATAAVALSGFDTILRVVGFVLAVSPTVDAWSLGRPTPRTAPPPAYGLRMVQWQVLLIYVCTVWLKAPDPFWRAGAAVPYFLMSIFARHPTAAAAHLGAIGALLTYGTLIVELSLPFLLWVRKTRWLGVGLGVGLHVGIALTSELALFTLAMLPLYTAYLEADDFERLSRWFGFHSRPPWYRFAPRFGRERDSAD